MINNESYGFNTFVATKVGEIQSGSDPKEWVWIESENNIADIISRGAKIVQLGEGSPWQRGPTFLALPMEEWPTFVNYTITGELPEQVRYITTTATCDEEHNVLIDINRFSKFLLLLCVTARILRICSTIPPSLLNLRIPLQPGHLYDARKFWEREAQSKILQELEMGVRGKGTFRKLNLSKVDGIYVAVGRMEAWTYSDHQLVVLPHTHQYSKLYAEHIHNISHSGVRSDTAKIRSKYWIVGLGKLVRSIRYHCVTCRKQQY